MTLGALSLPAGAYAVTATFQLSHQEGTAQPVICQITVGSETSDPYAAILEPAFQGNFNNLPVTLTRAGPLAADGTASVSCKDNAGVDGVQVDVRRIHLSAVRVGNLVTQ